MRPAMAEIVVTNHMKKPVNLGLLQLVPIILTLNFRLLQTIYKSIVELERSIEPGSFCTLVPF
jgi:hypothetical protein